MLFSPNRILLKKLTHAFSHYDLKYSIRIACLLSRSVNHVNSLSPDLPNDLFRVVVSVHTTDAAPKASMWVNLLGGLWPSNNQRVRTKRAATYYVLLVSSIAPRINRVYVYIFASVCLFVFYFRLYIQI